QYDNYVNSTRWLYEASFLRLKNISFGYSFPKNICSKLNISRLRIYVSGTNLWTLTNYPGWDPEVLRNLNPSNPDSNVSFAAPSFATPQSKSIIFGVQLSF
ncbi:MAG TPA: hypothetical protein P5509_09305, partial [Bacteroidales bacterium]|nr:hypothetical protein [Bacteroidales bacterium]